MRSLSLYLAFGLLCGPIAAQEIVVTPLVEAETEDVSPLQPLDELIGELTTIPFDDEPDGPTFGPRIDVLAGVGGQLRVLDKLTGVVTDMELTNGEVGELGFLTVTLQECRYPSDNPAGDAFAFVEVQDSKENIRLFSGWIIASAPALNAMDHPRYDVWALRCTMSAPDDT
jgi:hypothetical protein